MGCAPARSPRGQGAPRLGPLLWALALALAVPGGARAAPLAALPVGATVRYAVDPLRGYRPLAAAVAAVGRTLLLADSPEVVRGPGLLYRDRVQGPFRVFLYALDGARGPMRFAVVVSNPSPYPVALVVTRAGIGGPSSQYFGVATLAQAHYFASGPPRWLTVPARGAAFLDPGLSAAVAHPGQLVNAIVDASATEPVWVSMVAERRRSTDLHGMPLLPPGAGPLMRGTFPNADFEVGVSTDLRRPGYVMVGENPRFLHGYSWVDRRVTIDYGNYGVLYNIRIAAAALPASPVRAMSVLFTGRGVSYAGLALLSAAGAGRPVILAPPAYGGVALVPDEAVVLAQVHVHPGRTSLVRLQWMPAGASTLPAAFLLAP
jgi:hypothetical protein